MQTKFILLAHPRTGSTLLRELLNQNPDVLTFSELFHPYRYQREGPHAIATNSGPRFYADETEDAFAFLDRLVWTEENFASTSAVGFKLFSEYVQAQGTSRLLQRIKHDHTCVRIVHLVRENLLDSWISLKLAERIGMWQIGISDDRSAFDAAKSFESDPFEMQMFFETRTSLTNFNRNYFDPGRYLEISYSDLESSPAATALEVFRFLRVRESSVTCALQKQNLKRQSENLKNYRELKAYFSQTSFAKFFQD